MLADALHQGGHVRQVDAVGPGNKVHTPRPLHIQGSKGIGHHAGRRSREELGVQRLKLGTRHKPIPCSSRWQVEGSTHAVALRPAAGLMEWTASL
jgi:hypothetical protein